jgi:Schlafen, AlbA_2
VEQSQNSIYEIVMSPALAAAATHSLVNTDTSRLGILLWFLIHSDAAMSSLKSTRVRLNPDDALAIYRDEWTAFGHEVGRDEIDWWINRKETNLAEFSKRATLALESGQALKESSQVLKKIDVERYEDLIEQIKTFAVKQSRRIAAVLEFVAWLHSRDPLAPSILFIYKVWGSTRMADRIAPLTQSASSPSEETPEVMERLVEIAWGFQSRGLYTYVHAAFDIAADFYEDPSKQDLPLPAARVVRRTAREVTDECATFFEFIRNSLRDIEKELEERSTRESRITSEFFWRSFIEKARKSARAESLAWDFKETISFWHAVNGDARRIEKTKFASDIASFANAEGGCLIVGVTDDRKVVGVSNDPREIENRLTSAHQAIRDHFRYPRDICRILQVSVPDDNGAEQICFVFAVPKACEPAASTDGQGSYTYPQRTGAGTIKADKDQLLNARFHQKHDSYGFLDELDQFAPKQE